MNAVLSALIPPAIRSDRGGRHRRTRSTGPTPATDFAAPAFEPGGTVLDIFGLDPEMPVTPAALAESGTG